MGSRIRKIITPPVFADDVDKTRLAGVLHVLLSATIAFVIVLEIIFALFDFPARPYFLIGLAVLLLALAIAGGMMRRGHVRRAAAIFTGSLWLLFTLFLPFAGGMQSVMVVFYIAGAAIVGLLLGKHATAIYITLCGITGLGMILLQNSPYALPPVFPILPIIGWATMMLALVLTVGAVNLVLQWRDAVWTTLREKTEELDRYFILSLDLLCIADTDGNFIRLNPEWEKTLGYPLAELESCRFLDFVHPDDMQATLEAIAQLDRQHAVLNFENRYRCKDGSYRWIEWRSSPQGKSIYAAARDVTTRKQAEQALEESEARYRSLFENNRAVMMIFDREDGTIIDVNPAACAYYGWPRDEFVKKHVSDIDPSTDEEIVREVTSAYQEGRNYFLFKHRQANGDVRDVEVYSGPITVAGRTVLYAIIHDVTERRLAEESLRDTNQRLEETLAELRDTQKQMMHQERLAAVGQLAAGIAHDFNNILASIILYTQMSLRTTALPECIRQRLEVIAQQTERAADLVQQILDFGRQTVLERRPLMLDVFAKEVVKLLQRTLPENIHIDLTFEPGDYVILADPTRIQQIVVNLALNACDAMPAGGKLHISLARIAEQTICCVDCGPVLDGEWVEITVADTGSGIPPKILPHIFEPFFTTRAPLGHGLGLAQVYGLVNQHAGHIAVETELNVGTTFRLYWPALPATLPLAPPQTTPDIISGRGETLLVVEDDALVRTALVDTLEALGYHVLAAVNGQAALALYAAHTATIALVLSDWVMPEMGGLELVRILQARAPALKVLVLTGHPLSQETRDTVPANVVGWTLKPPSLAQLARDVSKALDAR